MSRHEKACILGATGPTGFHLARLLELPVRVVSRSEDHLARVFPEDRFERVAADASREADATRAIEGCDLVVDCIGLPPDSMHLHPVTARNIAGAIGKTGARCVQVSSFWAYLPIVSLPVTEDHPRTDGPEWSRIRRETEDILLDAGAAILHLPDFYGPHVHTSTLQNALIDAVHGRPMNWIGAADTEHEFVFVPDAMRIAAKVIEHEGAYGERWALPGSGPITGQQVAEIVGGRLRAASPTMLRIVSLFSKDLRTFMPMVPHYVKPVSYSAKKLEGLIGSTKMTPYKDGIQQTLESLRE